MAPPYPTTMRPQNSMNTYENPIDISAEHDIAADFHAQMQINLSTRRGLSQQSQTPLEEQLGPIEWQNEPFTLINPFFGHQIPTPSIHWEEARWHVWLVEVLINGCLWRFERANFTAEGL